MVHAEGAAATARADGTPAQAWAAIAGLVSIGPAAVVDVDAGALSARAEIHDRFARFGIAYDQRDLASLVSCFSEDAVYELRTPAGRSGRFVGRDEIGVNVGRAIDRQGDQRRHLFTNVLIEDLDLDLGTATATAYALVMIADDSVRVGTTSVYPVHLRRDGDRVWRFDRFVIAMDVATPAGRGAVV